MQSIIINSETFLMSNMCPQHPTLNRKTWLALEHAVRELADKKDIIEVYAICGPIFNIGHEIQAVGDNRVMIPSAYFKSILAESKRGKLSLWSFILPNKDEVKELKDFLVPTNEVEWKAGLHLWDKLHGERIMRQKGEKAELW